MTFERSLIRDVNLIGRRRKCAAFRAPLFSFFLYRTVQNTGTEQWPEGVQLRFSQGHAELAPESHRPVPVSRLLPWQRADISVELRWKFSKISLQQSCPKIHVQSCSLSLTHTQVALCSWHLRKQVAFKHRQRSLLWRHNMGHHHRGEVWDLGFDAANEQLQFSRK